MQHDKKKKAIELQKRKLLTDSLNIKMIAKRAEKQKKRT